MSKSKELFMQSRQGQEDVAEYFQWLKEEEWQAYLDEKEAEYHARYGYGLHFRLMWIEFLKENK